MRKESSKGIELGLDNRGLLDKNLLVVCILGAVAFMADLVKEIKLPLPWTMAVSAMACHKSSGVVRIMKIWIGYRRKGCPGS